MAIKLVPIQTPFVRAGCSVEKKVQFLSNGFIVGDGVRWKCKNRAVMYLFSDVAGDHENVALCAECAKEIEYELRPRIA